MNMFKLNFSPIALIARVNNSKHRMLNWSAILFLFSGLLLALLVPEDITLDNTLIGKFCSMISILVPSIPNYAKISNFPNVATVFFSVMWALTPFMLAIMLSSLAPRKLPDWVTQRDWKIVFATLGFGVFAILFCLLFIYLFVYMPVDLAEKVKPDGLMNRGKAITLVISHSRLGLATYGGLLVLSTVIFATALIAYILGIVFAIYVIVNSVLNVFKGN